jgi:hypothetical protein
VTEKTILLQRPATWWPLLKPLAWLCLNSHDDQYLAQPFLMEDAMQHITKLCADNLRTLSDNHGIKLKATHAHELVAAFFGYKSRAALLADTSHPLSNLRQASVIVLLPTTSIDQRRKDLQELPPDLPDNYTLGEWVYSAMLPEKWILSKVWPAYEMLAIFLADEYLRQNRMEQIYRKPVGEGITIEKADDHMRFIVKRFYQAPTERMFSAAGVYVHEANITTTIQLQRVAGYIGYAKPVISVQIERVK